MKFEIVKKAAWCSLFAFLLLTSWLWLPLLLLTAPIWAFCGFICYWTCTGFRKALRLPLPALLSLLRSLRFQLASVLIRVRKGVSDCEQMNLGYAVDTPTGFNIRLDPEDDRHRFSLQLYHYVGTGLKQFSNLRGFHIIELNCSQGLGLSFLLKSLRPASALGVTTSSRSSARLNQLFASTPNLRFHPSFPSIRDSSADAVLSLEPGVVQMRRRLKDVVRVLKPGGHWFYADWMDVREVDAVVGDVEKEGLVTQYAGGCRAGGHHSQCVASAGTEQAEGQTFFLHPTPAS